VGLEGTDGSKGKKITAGCCFVSSNSKKRRESTGGPREVIKLGFDYLKLDQKLELNKF